MAEITGEGDTLKKIELNASITEQEEVEAQNMFAAY